MNAKNISLWTRMSRLALGVLVVAGSLLPASGQEQFSWKGDAPDGYFKRGADGGRWYKHSNGDSYWDAYDDHGIIFFANDRFPNMTNNAGNPKITHQIYFSNNTARTISGDGFRFYVYGGSSYPKIQNDSSGTHTFNSAITGDGDASDYMELNPVSGNLVFNGAVNNNGSPIRVWGSNTLYINGVHSGGGQLQVKSAATVVLTNANTYSGGTWIEKGKVEINTRSNALGTGAVNVGTNATLDIKHAMNLQPLALTLYNGTVTKTTTRSATWYGGLTTYNSSTVSVSSGNLYFRGGFDIASGSTLVFSNVNAGGMDADTMTGAGTLVKYGGGTFRLRPGTHSGNIELKQGNIWQYTGTMNSGGTLTMDGGTEYSADSTAARTLTKAVVIKGGVALAQNSTGGLEITNTVSLDNGTRIITNKNQVLISGKISSGGLGKAGDGTMILTGDNDYAGGTVISGGTLQIGNNGTAGVVTGAITNNAALVWYRSDSVTNTGVISGTGTLTKQGAGTLTLTGSSTMSGGTTVSA
ncbi:MAG TPA: autotransporter-associated beta strand repeat-containing protein, partial [Kiritimatiellia bacterium]|nr:autotransporter-associated beta strand repeat-containing protein [Kiritimatiellia bacterium]